MHAHIYILLVPGFRRVFEVEKREHIFEKISSINKNNRLNYFWLKNGKKAKQETETIQTKYNNGWFT